MVSVCRQPMCVCTDVSCIWLMHSDDGHQLTFQANISLSHYLVRWAVADMHVWPCSHQPSPRTLV